MTDEQLLARLERRGKRRRQRYDVKYALHGEHGAHTPRYRYDCGRCKFNWCCGELCACALTLCGRAVKDPPPKRRAEVDALQEAWRRQRGHEEAS